MSEPMEYSAYKARQTKHDAAVAELVLAARVYLATNKVYRGKPIGAPGSVARSEQKDRMQAEDALIAAIVAVEEVTK